jgi:four helix bundle suffix protein
MAICLIHQANYLLDRQRSQLEKDFVKKGGIRAQITKARHDYRKQQQSQPPKTPNRPKD